VRANSWTRSLTTVRSRRRWGHHARPRLNHLTENGLVEYVTDHGYRWTGPDPVEDVESGVYDLTEEF
jgi:hypothetical protein